MKKTLQNTLKVGAVIALMLSAGAVSAQQIATGGTAADGTADVIKSDNAIPGKLNGSVRVIDNKGTIKYLQSKNGLTMVTNTTNDVTTTTWQLGGTLTDDTYIDAAGGVFALNNIKVVDPLTEKAATTATLGAVNGATDASGFTLLVRDEFTGETKKLLATDLITSGQTYFTATSGQTEFTVTVGGAGDITAQAIPLPTYSKVWVYRNGAKLIANVDYTVGTNAVTLDPKGIAPNDWAIYDGDVIEVQYIK